MNKNEFLEKIREENAGCDPREYEIMSDAISWSGIFALMLGGILVLLEMVIWHRTNYALFVVSSFFIFLYLAIKAVRLKRKRCVILAGLVAMLFVAITVLYAIAFVKGWVQ